MAANERPKGKGQKELRKRMGFLKRNAKEVEGLDPALKDSRENDIIIPVMGPTGVGKSTFINNVSKAYRGQGLARVGHTLSSCTSALQPVVINLEEGQRLVMVDTPGFDDTYIDDVEILKRISVWLGASYSKNKKLAGVIYLYDISQTRMLGTTRKNLTLFRKLCGDKALASIILGTTKWEVLQHEGDGVHRESQLRKEFWKDMIAHGSRMVRVGGEPLLAQVVIGNILDKDDDRVEFLKIQEELVSFEKFIPDTDAGQELRYTLKQLAEMQKSRGNRDEVRKAMAELRKLNIPFSRRLAAFFGLRG